MTNSEERLMSTFAEFADQLSDKQFSTGKIESVEVERSLTDKNDEMVSYGFEANRIPLDEESGESWIGYSVEETTTKKLDLEAGEVPANLLQDCRETFMELKMPVDLENLKFFSTLSTTYEIDNEDSRLSRVDEIEFGAFSEKVRVKYADEVPMALPQEHEISADDPLARLDLERTMAAPKDILRILGRLGFTQSLEA